MKKLYLILLIVFISAGCSNNDKGNLSSIKQPNIWAIGDCYKVNPADGTVFNPFVKGKYKSKNFIWDTRKKIVSLSGAKNEYLAFQIIIEAKDDLQEVDILTSDFKGPSIISQDNITLFKEHYTKIKKVSSWPQPSTGVGDYPDALIPFEIPNEGAPFAIKKGRNQAVWVDTYIPKDAKAGEYTAVFSVIGDNFTPVSMSVKLIVWDFTLSDESHLKAWSNYGDRYNLEPGYAVKYESPEYYEVERNIFKLSHAHRLEALNRHVYIRPKLEPDLGDTVFLDWQPYDQRLGAFLDGTLFANKQPPSIFLLPINTWPDQRWPKNHYNIPSVSKQIIKHFNEKNWDLSRGYIYLWDEPEKKDLAELKKWAKMIKDYSPQLKTTVAFLKNFKPDIVNELFPYVDLWLVDASKADLGLFRELKAKGKEVGFYQQGEPWCGNENLDTDGLAFRTWPWIAAKYDIDVIYLYLMTGWRGVQDKGTIWENPRNLNWSNSQGVLLYPGGYIDTKEAIGSLRLKQLRRGLQDYEYIYLAQELGKDSSPMVNSIIKRALSEASRGGGNYGEWSRDPADWFKARKKLAYLILGKEDKEKMYAKVPQQSYPRKSKALFEADFEDGSADGWEGGRVQKELTYQASKYALKGTSKGGGYIFLEAWKKFRISDNTKLSFAYYCQNVDQLIINCWSSQHKKNFSQVIHIPRRGEWIQVTRSLKDFGNNIGRYLNSLHIAAPDKKGATLIIDNVRLYNE